MEVLVLPSKHLKLVAGTVSHRGEQISGVHVFLERIGGMRTAFLETSDESGHFRFQGIEEGRYKLWTCLAGWNELHFEIRLNRKGSQELLTLEMQLSN